MEAIRFPLEIGELEWFRRVLANLHLSDDLAARNRNDPRYGSRTRRAKLSERRDVRSRRLMTHAATRGRLMKAIGSL